MTSATGLIELGVKSYSSGRLEEAERLWREALALDPGDGRARAYLDLLAAVREAGAPSPDSLAAPARSGDAAPVEKEPPVESEAPVEERPPVDAAPSADPPVPAPPVVTAPGERRRFSLAPGQDATAGVPTLGPAVRKRVVAAGLVVGGAATAALLAWGVLRASPEGAIGRARAAAVSSWAGLAALPPAVAGLASRLWSHGSPAPGDGGADRRPGPAPGSRMVTPARPAGAAPEGPPPPAPPGATAELATIAPAIRWGMTVDELLASAPSAARIHGAHGLEVDGLRALAKARRWELGGRAYQADFLFDGAGRLGAIRLRLPAGGEAEAAFRQLVATLTAQLGEPAALDPGTAGTSAWRGGARWSGGRTAADLEGWTGASDGRVYAVDVQRGGLSPLPDGEVVLTLRARPGGESR